MIASLRPGSSHDSSLDDLCFSSKDYGKAAFSFKISPEYRLNGWDEGHPT